MAEQLQTIIYPFCDGDLVVLAYGAGECVEFTPAILAFVASNTVTVLAVTHEIAATAMMAVAFTRSTSAVSEIDLCRSSNRFCTTESMNTCVGVADGSFVHGVVLQAEVRRFLYCSCLW